MAINCELVTSQLIAILYAKSLFSKKKKKEAEETKKNTHTHKKKKKNTEHFTESNLRIFLILERP